MERSSLPPYKGNEMATTLTMIVHQVVKDSQYNYTVGGFTLYYTITDTNDGRGDDLTLLGDISGDNIIGNSIPFTFVSSTTNGDGFVALYNDGRFFLFQYVDNYTSGESLTTTSAPFAICFTTGTGIETSTGPVTIEHLRVGMKAVTVSGIEREIIWIGSRTVDCTGGNAHMAPVRVRANAFGSGVPERDALLSPGHPVLVRQNGVEVLVPIMNLINGTTIERTQMQSVTYWHIELDQHDILLADGLPAESFFDMGSRAWFDNDLDDVLANPDLVSAGQHGRCREVAIDGPLVEAERRRLADLFYADLSAQCVWPSAGEYAVQ
ncbi:Hint domain-containing protein [Jiella pelagia]|uniref:Hint domain-containing protein n=1 Tax=Jiella pelagia TaxID=2986949 RepID=A0ABY7C0M8_9HYPH|nr:Hint domain-containing protein [Jiella pelagia]WAP69326.1 Hint domain-containing protein [Jiella pelagia]